MLGDNIRKVRLEKGLGLNEVARLANITGGYLSSIENNKRTNVGTEILDSIANALNVPTSTFFDGEEEKVTNGDTVIDEDIRRIERARMKMTPKDKEKMMNILRSAFDDFFDD
ncbi:helix-turn-helix domain-containing protein [uncultured Clostridium sp.]|uniref:helix-turn-helix domain-containing protein n=1 Tax=uncultured Clostridium sp. TaxID=59620 RepID=UPI0025E6BD4B|nr:helix-turn-helix domain-containing protein [uncultured Clostridium sp.]